MKNRKEFTDTGDGAIRVTAQYDGSMLNKNGNDKGSEQGTEKGDYTGYGIPDNLYNADGKKFNTANVDEGNLSKIKVESGTNRKYVVIQDKSVVGDAGSRLYLSNPK